MVAPRVIFWAGICGVCAFAQTPTVGGGAPSSAITAAFQTAYARNAFNKLVGTPLENVVPWGAAGLIQLFAGVTDKTQIYALVKPDTTSTANVIQVLSPLYAYYASVTAAVAGYPTADTANCPAVTNAGTGNACIWQPFSIDYALFVYARAVGGVTTFATRDPFYSAWNLRGTIGSLGPAISAETAVTSPFGTKAVKQAFDQSAFYNFTSGVNSGSTIGVIPPFYAVYLAAGTDSGSMGLPITGQVTLKSGIVQQAFERGAIEYNPATGLAVANPAVGIAAVSPAGNAQLYPGVTLSVQALLQAADASPIDSRPVVWTTSDPKVVLIKGSGMSVTLLGVNLGTANISFTVEGLTSRPLTVHVVSAPCCQIGEGAPNDSVRQAMVSAVTRNRLSVQLPAASGVVRRGNGYVQQLLSADGTNTPYLIAVADSTGAGCVVDGAILSQYQQIGGAIGVLGYPVADATAGGTQVFEGGALAGSPPQLVTGFIFPAWKSLGLDAGAAGPPVGAAAPFQSVRGTSGHAQMFARGEILGADTGPLAGKMFFVTGLILARYTASGGPAGALGPAVGNETVNAGVHDQRFESGHIVYAPGDSQATEFDTARQPWVVATPSASPAGAPVHLVAAGFNNNANIRISQTGRPDFAVTMPNGAYAWDVWVPASAAAGTVIVKATDTRTGASVQGSYSVHIAAPSTTFVSIAAGDQQVGAPGAALAQPLVVAVTDSNGNALPGRTVTFTASPGAKVGAASVTTGPDGLASTTVRLPPAEGVVLTTAQAGSQFVTFSARAAAFSLSNFPLQNQQLPGNLGNGSDPIASKGALLSATSSVLRYHQNRGELQRPNGLADPASLNTFLTSLCHADSQGNQICDGFVTLGQNAEQTVNLWRAGAFVGNGVTVQVAPAAADAVRDLVSTGSPVLLALSLAGAGSHFVVATGILADGSLAIADPNPAFGQTTLNAYLNGFTLAGGQAVQGTLAGAIRLAPQPPATPGFLLVSDAPSTVTAVGPSCGQTLQIPGAAAVAGITPGVAPGTLTLAWCDGTAPLYEVDTTGQGAVDAAVFDLSANGGRALFSGAATSPLQIVSTGAQWTVSPLSIAIAGLVVNAASYTPQFAPGSLISIFGAGLGSASAPPTLQIGAEAAQVLAATPNQVNARIPLDAPIGTTQLGVATHSGNVQQSIVINAVAPAIFSVASGQPSITNQDGSFNSYANPAQRGTSVWIYATGLGAVSSTGAATAPVSLVINGAEIAASSASQVSSVPGLYSVKVLLPASLPPGLLLTAYLKQGSAISNSVSIAVQ